MTSSIVVVPQVDPSNNERPQPCVRLLFREDEVAQEVNETFTLTIDFDERFLRSVPPPTIRRTMVGIIEDNSSESSRL